MTIWTDEMIWFPSQCYAFDEQPDGTFVGLCLRWRWEDPWQAHIITGLETDDRMLVHTGEWSPGLFRVHDLHFADDQVNAAKRALLRLHKTGEPPGKE